MTEQAGKTELFISKFLKYGVITSGTVITLGFILFVATGTSGYDDGSFPLELHQIALGLISLKPYSIIQSGLILLILLPVMRVALSVVLFFRERDFLYVKITLLVLMILLVSFLIGKG